MTRYALLIAPSSNRVYSGSAPGLTAAELDALDLGVLGGILGRIVSTVLGGVPYLLVDTDVPLDERGLAAVSALSSLHALFEVVGEPGAPLLAPVTVRPPTVLDDDLVTTQRYAGKTNEQFTRLLLNVTAAASRSAERLVGGSGRRPLVLDPLCGRGTTLNVALQYGWQVAGIEIDGKNLDAYALFLRTWLQRKTIKHRYDLSPVRRDRITIGRRLVVSFATDRQAWKDGDVQEVTVIGSDTIRAGEFFRPDSVDLIVTDAPYGVRHGSRSAGELSRSAVDLLRAAVPGWCALLRPGGALGIAINTVTAPREQVVEVLAGAGLRVRDDGPYRCFSHRVDHAVRRDVVVAVAD
jgi:SAM-dependent methyltransferase